MPNELCQHGQTAPIRILQDLHGSQMGSGRHKCTNCAYQRGFAWGLANINLPIDNLEQCQIGLAAPQDVLLDLPQSQAGSGRHKCAICAYNHGFNDARALAQSNQSPSSTIPAVLQATLEPLPIGVLKESSAPYFKKTKSVQKTSFKGRLGVNYQSIVNTNKTVGDVGEALVEKWEKEELLRLGRADLAAMVEIIANTEGDGVGYDVLSFTVNGDKKFIEVKTTFGDAASALMFSATEVAFSKQNPQNFYVYRVHNYNKLDGSAKFYKLNGSVDKLFNLEPTEFRATRS